MRWLAVAITVLAVALAAAVCTAPARSSSASTWYWPPSVCKAQLQNSGVQLGDGRSYSVAKAYCVGLHNHCWLNGGVRRYKVFIAVMRSYNGVVRRFPLIVTGHHTWQGTLPVRILEQHMSAAEFNKTYGPAAWTVARKENQGGCYDIHP